jgi:hypothetical protein
MSAPIVYRFIGPGVDFHTVGELQQIDGVIVLVCSASFEDCAEIQSRASSADPVKIYALVGDAIVAVMCATRIRANPRSGGFQTLWVKVGPAP